MTDQAAVQSGGLARENARPEAREVLWKKVTASCVVLTPISILTLARACTAGRKGLVSLSLQGAGLFAVMGEGGLGA